MFRWGAGGGSKGLAQRAKVKRNNVLSAGGYTAKNEGSRLPIFPRWRGCTRSEAGARRHHAEKNLPDFKDSGVKNLSQGSKKGQPTNGCCVWQGGLPGGLRSI